MEHSAQRAPGEEAEDPPPAPLLPAFAGAETSDGRTPDDKTSEDRTSGRAGATSPDNAEHPPSRRTVRRIMVGLILAMLTSMLSNSIIATALPTIMGELGGQDRLAWVATAALLVMTASTPVWGKLSDIWGRRLLFQIAMVIFLGASIAAGLAQDINTLIVARGLQGLGIGGLATLPNIILGDVVSPRERGRYSGLFGMVLGTATVLGPLVGGFLVDSPLGWRWCFFITVPLGLVAFIVIQFLLNTPKLPRRNAPVDWLGASLIFSAASTTVLLLSLGGTEIDWHSPLSYALGTGALLLTATAVFVESRAAEPILPTRLFGNRTFVLAAIGSFCVGVMMFGLTIYLPQYLQMVHGMSPTVSGLMMLPLMGSFLTTSIGSGFAVSGSGRWKRYPVTGMTLCALGFTSLSLAHLDPSLSTVIAGQALVGSGLGMCMQILLMATQSALPVADLASGTASFTFFRNLGGVTGVAAFGAVMVSRLNTELTAASAAVRERAASGDQTDAEAEELSVGLAEAAESAQGSPEYVHSLAEPVRVIVVGAFDHAMQGVFVAGVPVAVLGLIAVACTKGVPLRGGKGPTGTKEEERDGAPAGARRTAGLRCSGETPRRSW